MIKQAEITIYGEVQGVGFRYGVLSKAKGLGLAGWVRNEKDGAVRIAAEGPEEKLKQLIAWCKNESPSPRIDRVEVKRQEAGGGFGSFEIKI